MDGLFIMLIVGAAIGAIVGSVALCWISNKFEKLTFFKTEEEDVTE